jgi:DNA-binding response OmpR family regulator
VLVLTAAQDPEDRRRAADLGADVFLTKPFSPLELLEAIERLLSEGALDQRT